MSALSVVLLCIVVLYNDR